MIMHSHARVKKELGTATYFPDPVTGGVGVGK